MNRGLNALSSHFSCLLGLDVIITEKCILGVKNVGSEARLAGSSLTSCLTLEKLLSLPDVEVLICATAIRMFPKECWED